MTKHCVICGASFSALPSSKKITCSKECSRIRKAQTHKGVSNVWGASARRKLSDVRKAEGYSTNAQKGLTAAMALPEGQRGEQNRNSKVWVLIDPSGYEFEITNLKDWARKHIDLFEPNADIDDREHIASNIRSGFGQIALSRSGKRKNPISTYKGWRLGTLPEKKHKGD